MKKALAFPEITGEISEDENGIDYFILSYMCPYCGLGMTISYGEVNDECYLLDDVEKISNTCDGCGSTLTIEITEPTIKLKKGEKVHKIKENKNEN